MQSDKSISRHEGKKKSGANRLDLLGGADIGNFQDVAKSFSGPANTNTQSTDSLNAPM
jgi:hypothetical protein